MADSGSSSRLGVLDLLTLRVLRDPRRRVTYPLVLVAAYVAIAVGRLAAGELAKVDFVAFYTAGAFVRLGRVGDLSSLPAQLEFQQNVVHAGVRSIWVSPPFVAWAFAPLARLPYPIALGVFSTLGAAAFVVAIAIARRAARLHAGLGRMVVLSLSYFPAFAWLAFGQTSALSLLLHCAVFALLARGRDWTAGALLGLFAFKPQQAIVLAIVLVVARRWRAVAGATLSASALAVLSLGLAPDETLRWVREAPRLFHFLRSAGYASYGLHGFYGGSVLLLDGLSPTAATTLAAGLSVLGVWWIARLWTHVRWEPATDAWRLAWAATVAASTLVTPHCYFYDLTILLLPAFLLAGVYRTGGALLDDGPIAAATVWVWALGFVGPYLTMALLASTSRAGHPIGVQLGVVAIMVWTIRIGAAAVAGGQKRPPTLGERLLSAPDQVPLDSSHVVLHD